MARLTKAQLVAENAALREQLATLSRLKAQVEAELADIGRIADERLAALERLSAPRQPRVVPSAPVDPVREAYRALRERAREAARRGSTVVHLPSFAEFAAEHAEAECSV